MCEYVNKYSTIKINISELIIVEQNSSKVNKFSSSLIAAFVILIM